MVAFKFLLGDLAKQLASPLNHDQQICRIYMYCLYSVADMPDMDYYIALELIEN